MFVLKRKQVIIAIIFCMVLVAGYINWAYQPENATETASTDKSEYLGEAEMVSAKAEKNPAVTATEAKTNARNKAMELLDDIIANPSADEKAKASALEQKTAMAQNMEKESLCEGIINSKGVGEAVVYIADGVATVTVKTEQLSEAAVDKITDVILSNTDIPAEKIKVSKMQ